MKRFFLLASVILAAALLGSNALADNTGQSGQHGIGYVNIRKIMASAPQIKQIQKELSDEFKSQRQAIIDLRNEITHLNNSYDELQAGKSGEEKEKLQSLQKQIEVKQLKLIKLQNKMQDDYGLRRNEELSQLQSLIVSMVTKVAREKNLAMVLNSTGVIYMNSRIDITPDVFNYLSEQHLD